MNNGDKPATGGDWKFLQELNDHQTNSGLTKREHFAGLVMQSVIAKGDFANFSVNDAKEILGRDVGTYDTADFKSLRAEMISNKAVRYADALLKALEAE